jgi:hypothetical protein
MNTQTGTWPGTTPAILLRILHFAPVRMALLWVLLTYLYLSCHFFRALYAKGPLQAAAASLVAGAVMLIVYAGVVFYLERRPAS